MTATPPSTVCKQGLTPSQPYRHCRGTSLCASRCRPAARGEACGPGPKKKENKDRPLVVKQPHGGKNVQHGASLRKKKKKKKKPPTIGSGNSGIARGMRVSGGQAGGCELIGRKLCQDKSHPIERMGNKLGAKQRKPLIKNRANEPQRAQPNQ